MKIERAWLRIIVSVVVGGIAGLALHIGLNVARSLRPHAYSRREKHEPETIMRAIRYNLSLKFTPFGRRTAQERGRFAWRYVQIKS